jgi:hypothetical protein
MIATARSHPLIAYLILTFAGFWGCIVLGFIDALDFWVPILGATAPAIAAVVVSGLSAGEVEVRALVRHLVKWRCRPVWYIVAFGLPAAEALIHRVLLFGLPSRRVFSATVRVPVGGRWRALATLRAASETAVRGDISV